MNDEIFWMLAHDGDLENIRDRIAALIKNALQELKETLGYWETIHLAGAIAFLALNVRLGQTSIWLRSALVEVEKAFVPPDDRNEDFVPRDEQLDNVTYEQLLDALNCAKHGG